MVPNSRGNSGHSLPWVGTHLKGAAGQGQQVGMCTEASGGLMCKRKREEREILSGSVGTSFLKVFLIYLKQLWLWSCLEAKTGKSLPKTSLNKSPAGDWRSPMHACHWFLTRRKGNRIALLIFPFTPVASCSWKKRDLAVSLAREVVWAFAGPTVSVGCAVPAEEAGGG